MYAVGGTEEQKEAFKDSSLWSMECDEDTDMS
jgi:hypothetical protein